MEFWLTFNNGQEKLRLPVPPSEFEISQGNINTVVNINDIGEINLIGKGKLATITISSFFPAQEYDFCDYTGFPKPYECVAMIEKWRNSGRPIRFIITETLINLACAIENFSYGEKDGSGDVYFTLELKEYRFVNVQQAALEQKGYSMPATKREITKTIPNTYIVKKNDTLWMIAKKLTGKGENWTIIAKKNNIKDPKKIYPGMKLVI
ncbi:LysM peptidoglycan-binding domain-containing protein [Caldanaerobacter subterraneus]|uniref:LysM peptidoglycan-binding domain-containing protein n=2 Tax=Caldanaerobacter subterraneus TaxID=911092 RepID=A0A7Y2L7Q0_9THEO|nr:LysM peptidoglycan-binding domain-containing protein [Caldanaerobacter subterraneus]